MQTLSIYVVQRQMFFNTKVQLNITSTFLISPSITN